MLGALTVFGHVVLAAATAVVTTLLLGSKPLLHGWVSKLDQQELEATLKLLLISVVMLPILPDQGYGPWAVFNPYQIWWMVVLIAGVSYLGYFAIRIAGDRHGPVVIGAFGGLVSSTVVSINLARIAKNDPAMRNALAAGILTACATMSVRTLLLEVSSTKRSDQKSAATSRAGTGLSEGMGGVVQRFGAVDYPPARSGRHTPDRPSRRA